MVASETPKRSVTPKRSISPPPTKKQLSQHPEMEKTYNEFQESMEKLRKSEDTIDTVRRKVRQEAPDNVFDADITGVHNILPPSENEMTTPTNYFNTGTNSGIQTFINNLTSLIPTTVPSTTAPGQNDVFNGFDFQGSKGFTIHLEVTPDGQTLIVTASPKDQGQNNPFGPVDPNPSVVVDGTPVVHYDRAAAYKIPGNLL